MMDDQQIRVSVCCQSRRCKARINCCSDAGNSSVVFHLKSVMCTLIILDLASPKDFIAVTDDLAQAGLWHGEEFRAQSPKSKVQSPKSHIRVEGRGSRVE